MPDSTHRHLTHIARGGAIGLLGAGVSAGAGFLLIVVVTNQFPIHVAGQLFTVTSAFLLLLAIATLGTETGLGRFLLRYEAQGRRGDIPPTLRTAFRPTIAYSIVVAAIVLVLAAPFADLIGLDGEGGVTSIRILALVLPLATWNALTLAGTRAFGRMRTTVLVDKIGRSLAQPLLVLLVSLGTAGLAGLTFAWALPYALSAVLSGWLFRRFLRARGLLHTFDQPTEDVRTLRRAFWRFTWPRSITRISQMAIQRLDIVLIAALRSPTEAAIYTAATRFVALGQFGTQAIQQVIQPRFTHLLARGEDETLRAVYQTATVWNMIVAWPMYVVVGCAPLAYLGLFGSEYRADGVSVVLLMSLSMLFAVASGPADTLLLMSGRSALSLLNSLAALVIDVGLCLVLIPSMGIIGAAVAWAVAVCLRCSLALVQTRVTMAIHGLGPAALLVVGINVVCFALPLLGLEVLTDLDIGTLMLAMIGCVAAYLLALWLAREPLRLTVLRGLVKSRRPKEPDGAGETGV